MEEAWLSYHDTNNLTKAIYSDTHHIKGHGIAKIHDDELALLMNQNSEEFICMTVCLPDKHTVYRVLSAQVLG